MATGGMIDWTERQLCDDGACTGVIGRDGRCGECGHAAQFWGDERRRGMRDADEAEELAGEKRAVPEAEGEIAERRLCPDGSCTGLIGDDGRCRVCGTVDDGATVRARGALAIDGDGALAGDAEDGGPAGDEGDEGEDGDDADADDDDRRLCTDGACTGLIGDDGRCRECGRVEEL